jgi:GT2 family glycosyltransferase
MMVRSESWIEAGGFDERYFFFLEETDLCRRIARSGKRVLFHPGLRVIHAQGGSADRDPAWARYQFFRSRYRFLEKWEGSRAVRAVYAKYFAWLGVKTGVYALLLLLSFGRFEKIASRLRVAAVLFRAHCSGFDPILPPGYPTGGSGDGDTGKGRKDPKAAVQ